LFVAVWPTADVVAALEGLPRADFAGFRWTGADQWHVTLRFLGEVPAEEITAVSDALSSGLAACPAREAVLVPRARWFGSALTLLVDGLDDVGAAAIAATATFGAPPEHRGFTGHLTIGRVRDRRARRPPVGAVQVALEPGFEPEAWPARWPVTSVALVCSHLGGGRPARYETVAEVPLAP
jgi:2'-5' RNA ligase